MRESKSLTKLEQDLVESFDGFLADLKTGNPLADKYNCHKVVVDYRSKGYRPKDVRSTRKILRASQAIFAQFIGVSVKTVRAWESGKAPSEMACRFMDAIQSDPEYWRRRFMQSLKVKSA